MPEDDLIKFTPQPPLVAQFNAETGDWEILVDDQWVSITHLIDSLVEVRTILQQQYKDHLP